MIAVIMMMMMRMSMMMMVMMMMMMRRPFFFAATSIVVIVPGLARINALWLNLMQGISVAWIVPFSSLQTALKRYFNADPS